ncbi:MAG: NAD(P)-binding domain-containing protein [Kofleriaceae bacterium]
MNIAVLGSGVVGQTLADGFLGHGHHVWRGSREPTRSRLGSAAGARAQVGTFAEAAAADVVVPRPAAGGGSRKLELAGADALAGKVVLDATNPIADTCRCTACCASSPPSTTP